MLIWPSSNTQHSPGVGPQLNKRPRRWPSCGPTPGLTPRLKSIGTSTWTGMAVVSHQTRAIYPVSPNVGPTLAQLQINTVQRLVFFLRFWRELNIFCVAFRFLQCQRPKPKNTSQEQHIGIYLPLGFLERSKKYTQRQGWGYLTR